MCLAAVAIAATVVSTIMTMKGQKAAGKAAQQQAEYQAQIADNNKVIAERNTAAANRAGYEADLAAEDAVSRGAIMAKNQSDATKRLIARQRTVLASNGVVVDEGSALDITSDTAGMGKLDELTIRNNADREALGLRRQARDYRLQGENFGIEAQNFATEAAASRSRGAFAVAAGNQAAMGTLIGGVGSVASKWYNFKKTTGSYNLFG